MILSVIIFNTAGAPRLSKFYTPTPPATQRALIASIFQLVSTRPTGGQVCSFLDAPELREGFGEDARVVYRCVSSLQRMSCYTEADLQDLLWSLGGACRQFATLTFVFTVSPSESELGILDLIQVFVEALDRIFNNVCELDLVFGFDEVNYTLAEIVQAGLVLETNISVIAANGTTPFLSSRLSYSLNPLADVCYGLLDASVTAKAQARRKSAQAASLLPAGMSDGSLTGAGRGRLVPGIGPGGLAGLEKGLGWASSWLRSGR